MSDEDDAPYFVLVTTYLSYLILILFGHVRDFFGKRFRKHDYSHLMDSNGFAPLTSDFESFYTRRLYTRIRDCWNRPITKVPGRTIHLLTRESKDFNKTFNLTGKVNEVLNLSSYNYLGFALNSGPCANAVEKTLRKYSISVCSPRSEAGTMDIHRQAEDLVSSFIGKEDSMIISMGFATNSTVIPCLMEKNCLIISDELNHASLVFGCRLSGAAIKVFRHNDIRNLEEVLSSSIAQGQPRTHRPWKKILVVIEGIYSMEGSIVKLAEIVALKDKYKFYLFLDEAHSIGALGPNGRGVCDLLNVPTDKIDIMMGTFTKSFGAAGGYIASSKKIIDHLKTSCHAHLYAEPIPTPVVQQIITSMKIIMGLDGTDTGAKLLSSIYRNSKYFMGKLKDKGFIVYGDEGSPVVPLLLFNPAKIPAFSRECLKRGIAVVVVGYPATPIITSRVRFCISAAHTKEDLDFALSVIDEVGDLLQLKVGKNRKIKIF
ncbi:PLP-dependent transferase [Rozella allomycis CSF55]|uniref:serine C-palmitoyltransferase n=1 Tax=Rozella allomycis (strain CSF55) TaxID=988480 RepID=A0A075AVQ1_ROZAC|nr:Pyridoxal phosphate-dependent transferase domain-containing protein 1 [Rozella allomycis CSF55]RKP20504.1 PLP-dependent transferase [Rozella allomycis CSF55]|eukprot:EPZ34220.1 Pyridoxal phosphate-dependent transferase domain-containing protein 1 [Rozella allomycis CSF55]